MRLVRIATFAALTGSLFASGTGQAAMPRAVKAKPMCHQITDPAGDATGALVNGPLGSSNDDYLDILGADVASDGKALTAVIRLKAVGADSTSLTGSRIYFNFSTGGQKLFVAAILDGKGGATYSAGDFNGTAGARHTISAVTGSMSTTAKEIHITAPASTWPVPIKSGVTLDSLGVLAARFYGANAIRGVTSAVDDAATTATYTVGAKSCVTPGR